MLLSNWEDQIVYEPEQEKDGLSSATNHTSLTMPLNKALESGAWTQSIIWSPRAPFRDFTQLELNEEDVAQEEKHPGAPELTFYILVTNGCRCRLASEETFPNR